MITLCCLRDHCDGEITIDNMYCAQEAICPVCGARYGYEFDEFENDEGEWFDAPTLTPSKD